MRKLTLLLAFVCLACGLTACGTRVEVPTGHVGKVLSPDGLETGVHPPSTFRLPYRWWWQSNYKLILAEVSDQAKEEHMQIFMPADKLNMDFDLRLIMAIPAEGERVDGIFARLKPSQSNDASVMVIDFDEVFDTYGRNQVREVSRAVVAKYTIMQILENREKVSQEIENALRKALADTPLVVLNAGLADVQPPKVIVQAQEAAKEREIAITRAEAQRAVDMTEADTRLQVAKRQQEIDLVEAETQAQVNVVLAKGITPAFVTQRMLRVMETMAASPNKVFIIPDSALQNPAMMMGVTQNAFASTDPAMPTPVSPEGSDEGSK